VRLRFFNTFEPVVPLFRDLLPLLAQQGHHTEVVLADRRYRAGEQRHNQLGIRFIGVPTVPSPVPSERLRKSFAHLSYLVSASALSGVGPGPDLNVFMTQPPFFAAWGALLKRWRQQPYVAITMDLYPLVAIKAGLISEGAPLTRALDNLCGWALRQADGVIVIGRCMAERVSDYGVDPSRIHVVTNWANTEIVKPISAGDNELRRRQGLDSKFVVMYSGNLGVSHYFDDILTVAHQLRQERDIVFVFVGRGSRRKQVEAAVERDRLPNVICLDYQPFDMLAQSLSMGDVHFVSLREGFEGVVVPSKAYGVLAAGRPMIYQGNPRGEIARMISENDVGSVVSQGDVAALRQAILHAQTQEKWRREAGRRARSLAEGRYGTSRSIAAYASVLCGSP
jgi:colanic acid biosynthesis glycosyl transferase WcaI